MGGTRNRVEMYGGGKVAMDSTLSFYTQDIRVLGIRTPPPTSLGLATPLFPSDKLEKFNYNKPPALCYSQHSIMVRT